MSNYIVVKHATVTVKSDGNGKSSVHEDDELIVACNGEADVVTFENFPKAKFAFLISLDG